jgi:L-iditol 2-dehydrogenase
MQGRIVMQGIVKYKTGDGFMELREVEEKPPGEKEVKVEVKAAGICGSDLHIYHNDINIPIVPPVVVGHEFSGVVVEKGALVGDEIAIGDRVTGESSTYFCGTCRYCRAGYYNLCNSRKILGYTANGCFTRYCNVIYVHKLPENVSFKAGAMTEPLACCVHGVTEQTGVSAGDFVVVTGPGPIGLLVAMVARAEGGSVLVCGTDRDTERLKKAFELGIPYTINIETCDAVARVKELTQGYGADVVFECSGAQQAAAMALEMVRKRGKYTQVGLFGRPIEIDFEKIAFHEIEVRGTVSQRRPAWERALALMERNMVDCEALASHEFGLPEWKRAFEMAEKKEGMKILLIPD